MPALELPDSGIELLGLVLILAVAGTLAIRELRKGIKLNVKIDDKRDDNDPPNADEPDVEIKRR